jgi:hypothetical protein
VSDTLSRNEAGCVEAYPRGAVDLESEMTIEELGATISAALFGGVPFSGLGTGIRDEVPALRLGATMLGLDIVLHGYGGVDGFSLDLYPLPSLVTGAKNSSSALCRADLSAWLGHLLSQVDRIRVLPC